MKVWIAVAAAGSLLATLNGCGGGSFDVKGTLTLPFGNQGATDDGSLCVGQGGYDDIAGGAQVVIKNGGGKRIAVGSLEDGRIEKQSSGWLCHFRFDVADVPGDGNIYTISIGSRDDYSFKKSDASDLDLALGE